MSNSVFHIYTTKLYTHTLATHTHTHTHPAVSAGDQTQQGLAYARQTLPDSSLTQVVGILF